MKDKDRFSVIRPFEGTCIICGRYPVHIHEVFSGTANRQKCIQDGLCVELCPECHEAAHQNGDLTKRLHRMGRSAYLRTHTMAEFIERYGKAYEQ